MNKRHPFNNTFHLFRRAPFHGRAGMTLIELLVVMALLAGLATFALTSMDDLSARSRYDITRNRMNIIRFAVEGDGERTGRFIADMGRLPKQLHELWMTNDLTAPIQSYKQHTGTYSNLDFSLYFGWNGPYITSLNISGTNFHDGFGEPFSCMGTNLVSKGGTGHTFWLTNDLSVPLAVPSCSLHIAVMSPRPYDDGFTWSGCESATDTNGLTPFITNGVFHELNRFYAGESNEVYLCLIDNYDTAPTNTDHWRKVSKHSFFTRAEAVLALPNTDATALITISTNLLIGAPPSLAVFDELAPGIRQVAAYGYYELSGFITNALKSHVETIEIRPGPNFITLYLTEPLAP